MSNDRLMRVSITDRRHHSLSDDLRFFVAYMKSPGIFSKIHYLQPELIVSKTQMSRGVPENFPSGTIALDQCKFAIYFSRAGIFLPPT